ncbi:DUF1611 domain-containing protein [Oscillatoria sp. CS-180]|uniref:DUF1611 domain-containing protein n=1 Tax=Oscillatoria sp. CS-180 TaxID=3021720 RepID=UPI002330E662|nr:DUF1611 domain-containing protein [Oscillatoria sp. CS-180]MDB9525868.1 DUF1611 domain-containing protein [Oscillatoria sp. CS-180]
MNYLRADHRIALLMHEGTDNPGGKTGLAMLRYSPLNIVAVVDQQQVGNSLQAVTGIERSVPIVDSVKAAMEYEPTVLAIGIAPSGGALPEPWYQEVKEAVAAGLSVVNGLHTPMAKDRNLATVLQADQWIWDVRQEPTGLMIGSAAARSLPCRRVLPVGTDMAIGKMSTNLELHRLAIEHGLRSKVIATGQTNLMLGDDGIPLDSVRVDFAAGAVEQQMMQYGNDHDILFIEGQGSLFHPGSTATLPLMRGSQPTHLIMVHRAGQTHIRNQPTVQIPPLSEAIAVCETVVSAGGCFLPAKVVGVALNTHHLDEASAKQAIKAVHQETGLPCTDVIRFSGKPLMDAILNTTSAV